MFAKKDKKDFEWQFFIALDLEIMKNFWIEVDRAIKSFR